MCKSRDYQLCTHNDKKELFVKNGYHIFECNECSHRFTIIDDPGNHINEVYSDAYFFDGKSGYPNYLDEKDILIATGRRYAQFISRYKSPGNLLDIGCAAGFIMKGFEEEGWQCDGIEPNTSMADYGKNELHLSIQNSSFEDFRSEKKFDLLCLIEVIGHFLNTNKVLQNISELLSDGGLVLIESWNMNSKIARVLGKRWHEYTPPSVINWYSDTTLIQSFNNMGFQLLDMGHPKKQINVKHALSLLDEKLPNFILKKKLISVTNSIAGKVTLNYPFHDLKWYLFIKSRNLS